MRVHNWSKWQSYRADRHQPPWIKLHRQLLRHPAWVCLTDVQRAHIVSIWILAADNDGEIPDDPRLIQKLCYLDTEPDLQALVNAGFLEADASVTSSWRQRDANVTPQSRVEKRREEESREEENGSPANADSVSAKTQTQEIDEWFDNEFWPRYPKKVGKQEARKAVHKLRPGTSLRRSITNHLDARVGHDRQWNRDGGKYRPNPATFINQHRFEDEWEEDNGLSDAGNATAQNMARWIREMH